MTVSTSSFQISFSAPELTTKVSFHEPEELPSLFDDRETSRVYIIDQVVYALYEKLLNQLTCQNRFYLLSATEQKKNISSLGSLIDFFIRNKVNRSTEIIAIGGGITLDLCSFAASIFKRGCVLTMIPTTFTAMIDAAIGGKTGINYQEHKNLLGSFYPAEKVLIVSGFLNTLAQKDLLNGWAECIKISLLSLNTLYNKILSSNGVVSEQLIREAIELKAHFCSSDLRDNSVRQLLNLGHTIAHLLESVSDYEISHGLGVSYGIRTIARYSLNKEYIDRQVYDRILKPLELLNFPAEIDSKYRKKILVTGENLLVMDKKNREMKRLVVFHGFQKAATISYENTDEVLNSLPLA